MAVFCNIINVKNPILIFYVICAKDNKTLVNSVWVNIFFTIYGPFKMICSHFRKFDLSIFKMTLKLHKKPPFLWQIFKFRIKCYYLTKFYHVRRFDSVMAALWIIFAFHSVLRRQKHLKKENCILLAFFISNIVENIFNPLTTNVHLI